MRREPTLPADPKVFREHVGFTSPWPVRARLLFLGLLGKARSCGYLDQEIVAKGWIYNGVPYYTRVRRWWWA